MFRRTPPTPSRPARTRRSDKVAPSDTSYCAPTMSLGLDSGTVRIVPYDSAWPALFAAEADALQRQFASSGLGVVLEHTGSTAVPGLAAKPILDILGGYLTGTRVAACIG